MLALKPPKETTQRKMFHSLILMSFKIMVSMLEISTNSKLMVSAQF
jgi:hypothetical protein